MADLIRWMNNREDGFSGYAGTLPESAYRIWPPTFSDEWTLTSALPGQNPGKALSYASGPDELKARAEELLRDFAASLGAVFPDTGRCECGGLARHAGKCQWRQGYGSHVISGETATGRESR